jgi:protein-S-isoprenylcysteine O-methyltransferase Ste14
MTTQEKARRPIGEALRTSVTGVAIVAVLLLIPAGLLPGGTWVWPDALAFLAAYGAVNGVGYLALAIWRPAHFRTRQQNVVAPRERRQPWLDAVGTVVLLIVLAAWVAFIPLDVFRLHLLPKPGPWAKLAGAVAVVVGCALTPLAAWENRFATPNVQDQSADGQRIVTTGVYAWVRHPIYLGNLLLFTGAPVWLGSYASLWGTALYLAATIGRIAMEETHLRAQFPQYAIYARKVRGRLIPFLV